MNTNFSYLITLLTIGVFLVSKAHGKSFEIRTNISRTILPGYDCTGKQDGYYPHPDQTKCSFYVLCLEQRDAYEQECGEGVTTNGEKMQLHFVANSGPDYSIANCDEPSIAGCGPYPTFPPIDPETEKTTTTTEETPSTSPWPTFPPIDPETKKTTTTIRTSSNPPVVTPQPPVEGKECDPEDCQLEGNCRDYYKCEDNHRLKKVQCEPDLFWNPNVNKIHGGVCDYFYNLDNATQTAYLSDETCIPPCKWFQTDEQYCSPNYSYQERFHGETENRVKVLSCPSAPLGHPKLFWNNEKLTCVKCPDAVDKNNQPCNCIMEETRGSNSTNIIIQ